MTDQPAASLGGTSLKSEDEVTLSLEKIMDEVNKATVERDQLMGQISTRVAQCDDVIKEGKKKMAAVLKQNGMSSTSKQGLGKITVTESIFHSIGNMEVFMEMVKINPEFRDALQLKLKSKDLLAAIASSNLSLEDVIGSGVVTVSSNDRVTYTPSKDIYE